MKRADCRLADRREHYALGTRITGETDGSNGHQMEGVAWGLSPTKPLLGVATDDDGTPRH